MRTIKSFIQIRTSGSVRGFRSCRHSTGTHARMLDTARVGYGEARRQWRDAREIWLCAGSNLSAARLG
ncbi:MAG: hypothetical protein V2B18_18215 [Pseudomonadota bacterium]